MRTVHLKGFTIVELLIVIVVIAVLTAVAIVAYSGVSNQAKEAALKSDVSSAAKQLLLEKGRTGQLPSSTDALQKAATTVLGYTPNVGAGTFCLSGESTDLIDRIFHITEAGVLQEGECPSQFPIMQTITTTSCPTSRIVVSDARDGNTYWIQKFSDGMCWMLTNLAYAGGGIDTYSDTKALVDGSGDALGSFTEPKYYIPVNANPTSGAQLPSISTDGGSTDPQYGYLYNWCAAMGVQVGTSACLNSSSPSPSLGVSVCPANWRLPTANAGGETYQLVSAINGGVVTSDVGMRTEWLSQYAGRWFAGSFSNQNVYAYYISSIASTYARGMYFGNGNGNGSAGANLGKDSGHSVRCVAST